MALKAIEKQQQQQESNSEITFINSVISRNKDKLIDTDLEQSLRNLTCFPFFPIVEVIGIKTSTKSLSFGFQ